MVKITFKVFMARVPLCLVNVCCIAAPCQLTPVCFVLVSVPVKSSLSAEGGLSALRWLAEISSFLRHDGVGATDNIMTTTQSLVLWY